MAGSKFDMHLTPTGSGSTVIFNGKDISDQVRMVTVRSEVSHTTTVTLEFAVADIDLAVDVPVPGIIVRSMPGDWEDWW